MKTSTYRMPLLTMPRLTMPLMALLLSLLVAAGPGLRAGEAPLWGNLEAGPYGAGFMTFEERDYGRTLQAKRDYFGDLITGENARPVQVCIWYPALEEDGEVSMVFSDYAFSPPDDQGFYAFLSAVQNREVAWLHRILMNNQTAVLEVLGTDMKAVRGAKPADGAFPLVLYACDFDRGVGENAVLCEYLASNGYVVAATPALGAASVRSQPSAAGLEAMVGDLEYLIATLHGRDLIEPGRLGSVGHAGGALAALLLGMRNYNVDAVAALEPGFDDEDRASMFTASPSYDIGRMTAPLLSVYVEDGGAQAGAAGEIAIPGDVFKYADRFALGFESGRGLDFTTYGLFVPVLMPPSGGEPPLGPKNYASMCEHVLVFLDEVLKGSGDGTGIVFGGDEVEARRAEERPPTQDEYLAILNSGNVEAAIEIYGKFKAVDPDLVLFPEGNMNIAGYRMLQQGRLEEAVALFKINAEAYPRSANCWDSLAEAYIATGDNELALQCVEKVIETLPDDTGLTPELRQALETNVERYMEQLTGEGPAGNEQGTQTGDQGRD